MTAHTAQTSPPAGDDQDGGDDALMARVALRDAAAFRLLVDRHARRAHAIGWRMTADGAEAEDIAQEAMLRLWSHAGRWQRGGPGVAAWLTRVATNLALDRLRCRRFGASDAVPERADPAPLADAAFDGDRLRKAARDAVQALPDRQRAAILLTYFEEQSNAHAAEVLEMNIKAFESLLLRARAALRQSCGALGLTPDAIAETE